MQGTVVMLMALSGLGCHNKYTVAYGPPTYSAFFETGCYANYYPNYMGSALLAPSCYAPGYAGTYSGCYSACYAGSYPTKHSCCFLSKLFGCCRCGKYGDPYGYMGYGGPGPILGPGPFMGGPGFGGPGPYMGGPGFGGPGPYMGGPGFGGPAVGGPFEPAVFGYALQFNYGDPTVDSVPVPTVAPPSSTSGAPSPAPPSPSGAAPVPPARDTSTPPPPPPPSPANVPGATARPGV